ncbi:MAG: hypothetical protein JWN29_2208 [Acidimicrobiales bacterium]|nr:hypothetical protein [Acidimicrobiales bacterium]
MSEPRLRSGLCSLPAPGRIVIERFGDSDAFMQHGENLAHLMDAIVATVSVSGGSRPAFGVGRRIIQRNGVAGGR